MVNTELMVDKFAVMIWNNKESNTLIYKLFSILLSLPMRNPNYIWHW